MEFNVQEPAQWGLATEMASAYAQAALCCTQVPVCQIVHRACSIIPKYAYRAKLPAKHVPNDSTAATHALMATFGTQQPRPACPLRVAQWDKAW